ncbi:MAG: hypothetical protein JWR55_467 [Aeromicrobium sp.]|jgi:hypothetical protein|nr:hypothetical protein [Aeromicrobium sp.]
MVLTRDVAQTGRGRFDRLIDRLARPAPPSPQYYFLIFSLYVEDFWAA